MINPRSKHFDSKYHYLRELVNGKEVELQHVPGKSNIADIFTKSLRKIKHLEYVRKLGLAPRKHIAQNDQTPNTISVMTAKTPRSSSVKIAHSQFSSVSHTRVLPLEKGERPLQ